MNKFDLYTTLRITLNINQWHSTEDCIKWFNNLDKNKYIREFYLLYHNEELWIKNGVSGNFDNPMGSYDLVKKSELVGCLLLYEFNDIINPGCHGL